MTLEKRISDAIASEIGSSRVEILKLRAMVDGQREEICRLMAELSRSTPREDVARRGNMGVVRATG